MSNPGHVMTLAPVIPVLVINDLAHAVPIAQALVAGGLPALEVTLRRRNRKSARQHHALKNVNAQQLTLETGNRLKFSPRFRPSAYALSNIFTGCHRSVSESYLIMPMKRPSMLYARNIPGLKCGFVISRRTCCPFLRASSVM